MGDFYGDVKEFIYLWIEDMVQMLQPESHTWFSILSIINTVVVNNKYGVGQALLFFMLSWTCMIYCQLLLLRCAPASLIHSWSFSPSPNALIADREPQQQTVLGNRRHPIDDVRSTARATSGPSYLSSLCLLGRTYFRCIFEPGLYPVDSRLKAAKEQVLWL